MSSTSESARSSSRRRHRAPIDPASPPAIPSRTYPSSVSTTNEVAPRELSRAAATCGSGPVVALPSVSRTSRGRRSLSRSSSLFSISAAFSMPAARGGQCYARRRGQEYPGSFATEGDQSDLIAALVGVVQQGEYGTLDSGHAFAGRHRAASIDEKEDQVPLPPLPDVLTQIAGTNLDPRSLSAPRPLVRRRGPYRRRQRHVLWVLFRLPIRYRMSGLTRDPAPAAERSSLALLGNLEPHRVERLRS